MLQSTELYQKWLQQATEDSDLIQELQAIQSNESEIQERFYRELEFGTGGLRGVIGAGTNRMNIYTVRKATQGFANYLKSSNLPQKVAIGYDSRIKSDLFAKEAARVLAGNGIIPLLYPRLQPTPALSWAVRYHNCGAGICITASHNPAKYNGYKAYGADGCQITLEVAEIILKQISLVDCFADVQIADFDTALQEGRIQYISEECINAFVEAVYSQKVGECIDSDLKLVYTPLNGAGLECVEKILHKLKIQNYTIVPEQKLPDGNFPTCPYPNPEIREAMEKGLQLCQQLQADLLIGTDPDCDRCGIAVPDKKGGYRLINGNETGVLLLDYVCKMRQMHNTMPTNPVAVTTIVSTDMTQAICDAYQVELKKTLTGFKFIGEQIGLLEQKGEQQRFIFGFEESYGYLSGSHVRDKDAVNATLLICQAAAWYAQQGKTLLDALNELYDKFGWYKNDLLSFTFEGEQGMHQMQQIMEQLRNAPMEKIANLSVLKIVDYTSPDTGLPKTNLLEYQLEGKAKLMIRPSGTEPKIKVYLSAVGNTEQQADSILKQLCQAAQDLLQ